MKQRIFLLTLLFLLILTRTNDISAKETKLNEDMFTNVENTLKDKEIDLSYTQLVKQLIHGNVKGVLHTIKAKMKEGFLNRMLIQKDLIREMTTLTNVVLLPMIKILFVLKIINHISKEEHFQDYVKRSKV